MFRKYMALALLALLLPILAACAGVPGTEEQHPERPAGWSEATHGSQAEPNYAVVFPQDKVNQITITIAPDRWAAMQDNMKQLYGEPGQAGGKFPGRMLRRDPGPGEGDQLQPAPGGGDQLQAPAGEDSAATTPTAGPDTEPGDQKEPNTNGTPAATPAGQRGGVFEQHGGPGAKPVMIGGPLDSANPDWVEATISFDGKSWSNVGVRYKGNSSLMSSWHGGSQKLPFKLDFDQFEGEHPEVADQRFYGFKQLSLSNNSGDKSSMREVLAYDLLAQAGLPAARTAYYEVVLDYGEGPKSLGLYTMIEVVDDTMLGRVFGDESGNIYEGDGPGAALTPDSHDQLEQSFQKENNKDGDWSDVEALYEALHAPERTSDPAAWRARLEALFDVDVFLEWLAVSAAIGHWDTYGGLSHNFYLYNNPATGKLTWISWDHNFVLGGKGGMVEIKIDDQEGGPAHKPFGEPGPGQGDHIIVAPGGAVDVVGEPEVGDMVGGPGGLQGFNDEIGGPGTALDKSDVSARWPLIRFLLDDPTYYARYVGFLRETAGGMLSAERMEPRYQQLAALIRPYAAKEEGEAAFDTALQELKERVGEREQAVAEFLATQR